MLLSFLSYVIKTLGKLSLVTFIVWLYKEITMGICQCCNQNLENKIVVISDGTSGLGQETAMALAKKGGWIILGCRDLARGNTNSFLSVTYVDIFYFILKRFRFIQRQKVSNYDNWNYTKSF